MPLPSDEKLVQLGNDLIRQFDAIYGLHPGSRPAHAKGLLLTGAFLPASQASSLTRAPHLARPSTPVTVRFSNSTGLPRIPDGDPKADPRGMAIRFHLAERVHTDIIGHSVDGFPVRTGQEFLEFLRAGAASGPSQPSPTPLQSFLAAHPAALAFVTQPKPAPASFAKEAYFGVSAVRFVNQDGVAKHGRYRIAPEAGIEHLDAAAAARQDSEYLFEELASRVTSRPVRFRIHVQLAGEGDAVDDATARWPEDRPSVHFGSLVLTAVAPDNQALQKHLIFDPIPRVDGIEPSADPLLELRAAIYLLSGLRRRQAAAQPTLTATS